MFDGIDEYTRRGDFQPNKDGYLVNGAGYYLMGIPVDPTTGNLVGSVPQVLKFQNDFLPAQATTEVDYRANLASYPLTPSHDTSVPGSELLNPDDFIANPLAIPPQNAQIVGHGANLQTDAKAVGLGTLSGLAGSTTLASLGLTTTDAITVSDGTNTDTFNVGATSTVQDLLDYVNKTGTANVTAALDTSGHIKVSSPNYLDEITVGGTGAAAVGFGAGNNTFDPTNLLTQGAVAQGQTLTVTLDNGTTSSTQTITFGNGGMPGEVATLQDLQTALNNLTNTTGNTVDASGNVTIKATNPNDKITLGGDGDDDERSVEFRHPYAVRDPVEPGRRRQRSDDVPQRVGRRRRGHRLRRVRLAREHPVALGQDRQLDARRRPYRYLEPVLSVRFQCHRHGRRLDQCRHQLHVRRRMGR